MLLIHLEVQAGRIDIAFPERMFRYRIRLYEKYPGQTILSCAIFLDREQGLDMETFHHGGMGDDLTFRFPVVNLAQWRHRIAKLKALAPTNPFAVVVLAQLQCRATAPDASRLASKLQLARSLARWNYDAAARRALFRIIDGLLVLPERHDEQFIETLEQTEEPAMAQQLTSLDRVLPRREKAAGMEEGLQKGELEGALTLPKSQLERKFGSVPAWAAARLVLADTDTLREWGLNVLDARRIEDVFGC